MIKLRAYFTKRRERNGAKEVQFNGEKAPIDNYLNIQNGYLKEITVDSNLPNYCSQG